MRAFAGKDGAAAVAAAKKAQAAMAAGGMTSSPGET